MYIYTFTYNNSNLASRRPSPGDVDRRDRSTPSPLPPAPNDDRPPPLQATTAAPPLKYLISQL